MCFFVPGSLGTFEGIRFTVLSTLSIAQVYGLAFGLMARLEGLFWNGLGLLAYAVCTRPALVAKSIQAVAGPPPALPPTALAPGRDAGTRSDPAGVSRREDAGPGHW